MYPWLQGITRLFRRSSPKPRRANPKRHRASLRVESLEDRAVPALQLIDCPLSSFLPMIADDAVLANIASRVCAALPQVDATLDPTTDAGTAGDRRTDDAFVTITGKTSPDSLVQILGLGLAGFSNALGDYRIEDVPLAQGLNDLRFRTTDRGGNINETVETFARYSAPTINNLIGDQSVQQGATTTTVNLANIFADVDIVNSIVRFDTIRGMIDAEIFDDRTPLHAANFLNYVTRNDYDGTIFHRSVSNFVLQGGGFRFNDANNTLPAIRQDAPVQNEPGISNLRATIALAKMGGNPNSGTNQFFFNLGNNSANLDMQNGGFTVFGQVLGDGMTVVDNLASIPTQSRPEPFSSIPLLNFPQTGRFTDDLAVENLVLLNDVIVRRQHDSLTFSVTGNTNTALLNATVANNQVTLAYQAGQTGTSIITVRATDRDGLFIETSFSVTVQ